MNISYTGPEIWYVTDVIIFHFGPFLSFYHPLTAHAWQTEFFVISDNFLSIYPLKTQKLKFWKNEKNAWKYYHFTQVYQKLGSCYTVPEVVRHGCNCYLSFWTYFCLFTPITAWKMKISKKMKKTPSDVIILHMRTKNYDHMVYCSWDMARDRCNCYFSFWAIFCPFTPVTCPKNQNFKKKKKPGDFIILHMCTKSYDRWCTVPEKRCATDRWTDGRADRKSDTQRWVPHLKI